MLFVTILEDFTLGRVNLDIEEMGKIALVSYVRITSTIKYIDCKKTNTDENPVFHNPKN